MNFFTELKRRNVYKVAVAYLRLNADWDGVGNDPRFQKLMNAKL
jgi:hypothetical protein